MLGKIVRELFGSSNESPPAVAPAPAGLVLPSRAETHASQYGGKTVISFSTASRSDGLNAGVNATALMFRSHGYRFENIDLRQDGWQEKIFDLLRKPEEIFCAIGLMGMLDSMQVNGPHGSSNLWNEAGVPFLSYFGDHPAYFFSRHQFRSQGHVSMYCFDEHIEAARDWLDPQPTIAKIPLAPWDAVGKEEVDFSAKSSGKVFFFKNGNSPAALRDFWRTLPVPISRWLTELSHDIDLLKLGRSGKALHVQVREYLEDQGVYLDARPWVELFLAAQLDDYARRLKSTLIAEALLDLPVHVVGDFWGHVDFTGRRAVHLPGRSYFDTRQLISESLCVMDMSPNVQSAPHDRFLAAIGRYTLCLSNAQKCYEDHHARAGEMMFEFDPQSIHERVAGVLARPAQAIELGVEIAEQARARLTGEAALKKLVECANLARFAISPAQFPGQQDFVAWPR